MAFIGLKHPVFAPIQTEPAGSLPTYGTGAIVGKAIAADVTINRANAKLAANDTIVETDTGFIDGTITCGVDDISDEVSALWFGDKSVVDNGGTTVIRSAATHSAPLGGFGYYRVLVKDKVRKYKGYWYYKTQWGINSENAATKPNGEVQWQTPTAQGNIMALDDTDAVNGSNTWRDRATFDTEAEAIAWLNEHANIGEPANLTNLNADIATATAMDPEAYTSASWVAVANALTEAQAVVAMESPSQARVDAAEADLEAAMAAVVLAV